MQENGGILSDETYEAIFGKPDKHGIEMARIQITYNASADGTTFVEMEKEVNRKAAEKRMQFAGMFLFSLTITSSNEAQNPAPYDGNLDSNYRLDQIELNSKNGFKNYDYVPLSPKTLDWLKENYPMPGDPKFVGPLVDKGPGRYDINGKYTGGRTQAELDVLADDPAHAGSTRQYDIDQGLLERKVGLSLEESGKLKGPITRDPTGAAEFFDADGQAWDVKSFNSNFKPNKGGYTLQKSMDSILDSLGKNENVLLDTSNLSLVHKSELLQELTKQGLMDKIIPWP